MDYMTSGPPNGKSLMKSTRLKGALWGGLALLVCLPAWGVTIVPSYGADFPSWAQTALDYAADTWDTQWIASTASDPDAENLYLELRWEDLGSGILGGASVNFWTSAEVDYWYTPAQFKIFFNEPNNPAEGGLTEGYITFNNSFNWYSGTDGNTPAGQYDFVSVALHELGHKMGFSDTYGLAQTNTWGATYSGQWRLGIYDTFLIDESGNAPEAGVQNDAFGETDNPVYFAGSNAVAANDGQNVPIYAPLTFSSGSSLVHLNEVTPFKDYLMSYSIGSGESVHTLSSVEWGLYEDLGWTMTPEPATATLALLAAAAGAWIRFRRK